MVCTLEIIPWVEAILVKKNWRPRYHKRVNEQNKDEETALHSEVRGGNEAVVQLLVDRGADVKAEDKPLSKNIHKSMEDCMHYAILDGVSQSVVAAVKRGEVGGRIGGARWRDKD